MCLCVQLGIQIRSIYFNQLIWLLGLIIYRFPLHLFFLNFVDRTGWLIVQSFCSFRVADGLSGTFSIFLCVLHFSNSVVRFRSFCCVFFFFERLHLSWFCVFLKMSTCIFFVMLAANDAQFLFLFLAASHSLWDFNSLFRDQTCTLVSESAES